MNIILNILGFIYEKLEDRFIALYSLIIIAMVVLLSSLFNMQIIKGKEYRENSSSRILRQEVLYAPRGEIYDRNGLVLASNKLSFDLEIYKIASVTFDINDTLLRVIKILEANGDSTNNTFPVEDGAFTFASKDEEKKWKKDFGIKADASVHDVYESFKNRYKIRLVEEKYVNKIINLRYTVGIQGYTYFKSAKLAKDISKESVAQLEEIKRKIPGIQITSVAKRVYPNSTLAAHLIGYVSTINSKELEKNKKNGYSPNSSIGKTGIELSFESVLKGTDGEKRMEVSSTGGVASETIVKNVESGSNVTLTIDMRLQKVAEKALEDTIKNIAAGTYTKKYTDANAGAVVVLDIETGEVLAMASYPTYDINSFVNGITYKAWNEIANNEVRPMYNRAISGTYSPASTYKMLVGLAALETGKVTVDEKIQDTGIYQYAHKPKCWVYTYTNGARTHGYINISEAIKVSCNCYFYELGRRMGIDTIVDYSKKFGFGQKTGIELYGEAKGILPGKSEVRKDWAIGDTLSASIGQSISAYTPIQMANYISILASGGKKQEVHVVKSIEDSKGYQFTEDKYNTLKQKISEVEVDKTDLNINQVYLNAVKSGMKSVTSETGGTSYIVFKGSDLEVAGKTGTAQVTTGSNNGIFVGFAPYDNPKIAIVSVIEHGQEGTYTANAVRPILEEYFKLNKTEVIKDREENVLSQSIKY